ncbi:hypothetical protein [Sulfoacidibacillus ferrooxidans]|uniref:Uncharacterized protein n=1 Tax=Sulfoacidibacillus ferrooxidans TaxID=2005001 RepID=A0A9X2AC24_9BACL|nr:hypothetical protein [Sulfoacidibacillus ferrooxidans]MCI0183399.1 hypothetical protein [Sulfoacidibacillus ferrooxidans]
MKRNHLVVAKIVAVLPHYEDGVGFVSRILTLDNEELIDPRPPLTIMKYLLRPYGFDYTEYRKMYSEEWVHRQNLPIHWAGHTFVMCKTVHAKVPGDETYGFIRLETIRTTRSKRGIGIVRLLNGREIETVQKWRGLQNNLSDATYIVFHAIGENRLGNEQMNEDLENMCAEDQPDGEGRKSIRELESGLYGSNGIIREFEERIYSGVTGYVKHLTLQQRQDVVMEYIEPLIQGAIRAWLARKD